MLAALKFSLATCFYNPVILDECKSFHITFNGGLSQSRAEPALARISRNILSLLQTRRQANPQVSENRRHRPGPGLAELGVKVSRLTRTEGASKLTFGELAGMA